jgi:hypothetical protein
VGRGTAEARGLCCGHIDEVVVLEEEASLDPTLELAKVLWRGVDTGCAAQVMGRDYRIVQREQGTRLDNGMVLQETELCNCNEKVVREMELCSERVVQERQLGNEIEAQERMLDVPRMVLALATELWDE